MQLGGNVIVGFHSSARHAMAVMAMCFIFEYGGEVLTNAELLKRKGGQQYSVALDAHWQSELTLGDNKLLSIDASTYTNVARWLNYRYATTFRV